MQGYSAALQPFSPSAELDGLALSARASWSGGALDLEFQLNGRLNQLVLAERSPQPQRRDGLWQSTCFEAFFGIPGQENYWEINLAPNGDWNLYALRGYRDGLRHEPHWTSLPFRVAQAPSGDALSVDLRLPIGELIAPESPLELSATAVLEQCDRGCSYWAWRHCGAEADFHRRDSFLLLPKS